ncbi:MAG: peptide ABC transporter substrate-binding protein [Candidatus Dormibacteria bacterium]
MSGSRRASWWMVLPCAVAVLAGACGGGGTGGNSSGLAADQTLRFPIDGDIGTLDPATLSAETDAELAINLFDGLLKFDDNLTPVPDIASKLPDVSADGLTLTYSLRSDAKFSNGDPITAQDFIFAWSRAVKEGQNAYGSFFAPVAGYDSMTAPNSKETTLSGLSAPDDHTLVVKLSQKAGYFVTFTAFISTAVVDKKVVNQDDANWWAKPATMVGSGPFKMSARTDKQSIDFASVDGWWGSPTPTLKKIHIDVIPDMASGIAKYDQGGYDLVGYGGMSSDLPPDEVLRIKADPVKGKELALVPKVRTIWVEWNFGKAPFSGLTGAGKELRLAMTLSIDRTQLVDVVCAHGILCSSADGGVITKGLKGYLGDASDPLARFDPTAAKQHLKTGDPDGSKTANLTYYYDPNKPIYQLSAQNLQAQWLQNLGINVKLQQVDHASFIQQSSSHAYILFRAGWQADFDHPSDWFDNLFVKGGGSNTGNFDDPAIDTLIKKADTEDLSTALADYQAAGKMLEDDAAYGPLLYTRGSFLFKPYLHHAGSNNFQDYYWDEMSIGSH